ncbi:TPA: helicase [Clostridioides difficile]|uniref:replicative DNA helicase n=1 Tax=Clostridioides difficile TaxID=1496 RepID=UPI00093C66B3|nr:DnaB-like helicase N-terminal domain-containing protein [Clostridioides difficile]MBY1103866.1 replicative DNA helicase [Clostridioides difficile]MDC9475592.1 DnaB-like helicase N-terminal domain-containing protein [Clostridioides difficile]HBE9760583.1 helicase [Clostridioides difficile]HBE9786760.1 helicase [Clostridioides difficile]HBG1613761.1 helicase [Clostridioides difficile]
MDSMSNLVKNTEAEQSILGSILLDSRKIEEIEILISEDMFYHQEHKHIFNSVKDIHKRDKPIDIITLTEDLKKKGLIDYVGGISYLTKLSTIVPTIGNVSHYIDIVIEKYKNRNIIDKFNKFKLGEIDDNTLIYQLEKYINEVNQKLVKKDSSITAISERAFEYINDEIEEGINIGIKFLDETIGGLYSGEMSDIQILFRNIASLTGISVVKMKNRNLNEEEIIKYINALSTLNQENNIYINDSVNTISGIKREIKSIKPDVVIIDYLQILDYEGKEVGEAKFADLSRQIKKITLDFNIPIIQLAQLNDELKDERPKGDRVMRSSKQIYMDSNSVIYIHRPTEKEALDYCKTMGIEDIKELRCREKGFGANLSEIIVAKNRDGESGFRPYWYIGSLFSFKECKKV